MYFSSVYIDYLCILVNARINGTLHLLRHNIDHYCTCYCVIDWTVEEWLYLYFHNEA